MRLRSDGEQRREDILEAACTIFGEKGYHKATFSAMGKLGGFNPALISFHFRSKDDLYIAARHKLDDEVQACWPIDGGLAVEASAKERLKAHIRASIGRHSDKRMKNFAYIHTQERVNATGLLDKELQKQEKLNREHMYDVLADLLGAGATESDIHLCEMSVLNQLAILRPPKPDEPKKKKQQHKPAKFTVSDIDRLTEHITQFSLGGIDAIRQVIANRKAKSMKYLLTIVLLTVLGFGAYYWSSFKVNGQVKQNTPKLVVVERGPLQIAIESTGTVEPEREVEIKCEASGEITKLPIDVSDVVKKGDLLVQLDPCDEELLVKRAHVASIATKAKLNQAKLKLKIAQQNLKNSRRRSTSSLTSAKVLAQETSAQLKRTEILHKKKITSKKTLQSAITTHARAIADLEDAKVSLEALKTQELQINTLQEDIRIAEQDVVASEIDLDEAQERLRETTVQSPIDGIVTVRDVQVGQIISSVTSSVDGGTTVLYIADMSRMYVLVSVDESDIGRIRKGLDALITADSYPEMTFKGVVVRVASKGISNSNVVTFEVKVEVTSSEKKLLKPGMTANVEILIVDKKDTLRVPAQAVTQTSKSCSVIIAQADRKTDRKEVKIGDTNGDWTEILSGLNEGDQLVVTQRQQSRWRNNTPSQNKVFPAPYSVLAELLEDLRHDTNHRSP